MNRFEYKTYNTAMELESILEHMGFKKRNFNSSPLVQYWEITKNEIVVVVNLFTESSRWETFIVLRGDYTMDETTLSRQVKNIKGVLDLKSFISYL